MPGAVRAAHSIEAERFIRAFSPAEASAVMQVAESTLGNPAYSMPGSRVDLAVEAFTEVETGVLATADRSS